MTIAVTAMLLAMMGYEVDIVCYSEYLTERDKQGFASLFDRFAVGELIQYGTFKDLCSTNMSMFAKAS